MAVDAAGHVTAVLGLLAAAGLSVHDAQAPAKPLDATPYVIVWASPGAPVATLGARDAQLLVEFQTTAVGSTAEQARWCADRVAAVLLGAAPTVPGRTVHPIRMAEPPQPLRRDDDLAAPLFYAVTRWVLHTSPA